MRRRSCAGSRRLDAALTKATSGETSTRTEERLVGQEGRYWRDWSSDVCSSDLLNGIRTAALDAAALVRRLQTVGRRTHEGDEREVVDQIGRAACRGRV